jgi:IS30 family transposase
LSFHEREELALLKAQGLGVRAIARELNRDAGTISRELRRNAATRGADRSTGRRSRSGRHRPRPDAPSRRSS